MPPKLRLQSQRLFGGEWDFEVYLALTKLFEAKDVVTVSEVKALCNSDLKGPTLSKHLGELTLFGLLRRVGAPGTYEKVDDPFWIGIGAIVRAWDINPPTPSL